MRSPSARIRRERVAVIQLTEANRRMRCLDQYCRYKRVNRVEVQYYTTPVAILRVPQDPPRFPRVPLGTRPSDRNLRSALAKMLDLGIRRAIIYTRKWAVDVEAMDFIPVVREVIVRELETPPEVPLLDLVSEEESDG